MASDEVLLRWEFPPASEGRDMRTFNVHATAQGSSRSTHLYKFTNTIGISESDTVFERWNPSPRRWEIAGEIHWNNDVSGTVQFGLYTHRLNDIRRKKDATLSRFFTAKGSEYKWKPADNGTDLYCFDANDRAVAIWSGQACALRASTSVENVLDHLVVTCLVNLWFRAHGYW